MSAFRTLLRLPAARALAAACLTAWFAFSSLGLIVILVVHEGARQPQPTTLSCSWP